MKTHIRDHYVLMMWNMGITDKKYRVSLSFCRRLGIFGKPVG
jgi:hypothetical protein